MQYLCSTRSVILREMQIRRTRMTEPHSGAGKQSTIGSFERGGWVENSRTCINLYPSTVHSVVALLSQLRVEKKTRSDSYQTDFILCFAC